MNEFDKHWHECAARARQENRADEPAPFGFSTRVLAMAQTRRNRSASDVWYRMTLRALACSAALLLVLVVMEVGTARPPRLDVPHIENTVAQTFWML